MSDNEIIQRAIEILQQEVIGEGCATFDYEDFADEPDIVISRDINEEGRCYSCAAQQVVVWLLNYLALENEP
jgi:hypothetical protein